MSKNFHRITIRELQKSNFDSNIPRLTIEAPQELAAARLRLESFDTGRLRGVMQLVGLDEAGESARHSARWEEHEFWLDW